MKPVLKVNGQPVDPLPGAELVEVEPGVFSILLDGRVMEAVVTGDEVHIAGTRLTAELEDPRKWSPAGSSRGVEGRVTVRAAMPGKVVRLLVAEGQEVEMGQGLIVVEAMKMQNEMKSPRAGRVTGIAVKEHDAVNAGAVLLAVE